MSKTELKKSRQVDSIFDQYPPAVRKKMERLRKLVFEVATSEEGVIRLEETIKWGEPSYVTKSGSTLRMDWKEKAPDQYAMYFTCTTGLVPTFKMVFGDLFKYEGNRGIIFGMKDKIPEKELKKCILASLTYHKVKNRPMLGL